MPAPDPIPLSPSRRRFVRVVRLAAAVSIILAAFAVALVARGQSQPYSPMLIATALVIGLAVLLGTAVMMLISLANRRGQDAKASPLIRERDEP